MEISEKEKNTIKFEKDWLSFFIGLKRILRIILFKDKS